MNTPTPAAMVKFYIRELTVEDWDLRTAIYELNRSLESRWPEDLPRAVPELLDVLGVYRNTVEFLVENIEKAFDEEEEEAQSNN